MPRFIVFGPNVWGAGHTPEEARKIAAKEHGSPMKKYLVYLVSESTRVTGLGDFSFNSDDPKPIELYAVVDGKQISSET